MALVTMREMLQDARTKKYAVGGFNVFNFETLSGVVEVAEELNTPVVIGIAERLFKFVDVEILSGAMVRAARRSKVPIALHLDHGYSYEGMMRAIKWGFTSVMFDGSKLPFAENLQKTRDICRLAHTLGMTVEGELGYVGAVDGASDIREDNLVSAAMAVEFVKKTGVDALAVAFGNNHGSYRGEPKLNISHLNELHKAVDLPLVMHGGFRLSRAHYSAAIEAGITKVNIPTDISLAAADTLRQELAMAPKSNYIHLMSVIKKGVKESVRKYMFDFGCIAKAALKK